MAAIEREKPLPGSRSTTCSAWDRPAIGAGLLLRAGSRQHKWGLVLETIHFALARAR